MHSSTCSPSPAQCLISPESLPLRLSASPLYSCMGRVGDPPAIPSFSRKVGSQIQGSCGVHKPVDIFQGKAEVLLVRPGDLTGGSTVPGPRAARYPLPRMLDLEDKGRRKRAQIYWAQCGSSFTPPQHIFLSWSRRGQQRGQARPGSSPSLSQTVCGLLPSAACSGGWPARLRDRTHLRLPWHLPVLCVILSSAHSSELV